MKPKFTACISVLLAVATASGEGLTAEQVKALPPPASHRVDFKSEVQPIFEASCIRCHGRGRARGGLKIDSRESLLKGGEAGPAAVPGDSANSYLIKLVAGVDPDEVMPKKGKKLTAEEVGVLRAWIEQGLTWDSAITFGPVPPQNLEPRMPAVPVARQEANPVDRFLDVYFQEHHIKPPPPVSDRVFARRVYLDTIGLLPPAGELKTFVSSRKTDKRAALVKDLLSREESCAQNWLTYWNDLLRNDYKAPGEREQITKWLYSALLTNMPYDQFVAELVNPRKESEGFIAGIVWRGVVNASQMPQLQAAQNFSQVFMGVNLKCASCHDSFINDWQLSDAYGLANVFSDQPLEIYRCDVPTGEQAAIKFIFPQLGDLPATTNKQERLRALARIVTCPKDGRLSRTMVNRLWARFLGRGLVEPVDDMQQTAWDPDVLDWLAQDLVEHGYNLKETMERILTSRAYQLPAVDLGELRQTPYVFTGPDVRRLTAEEFRDALASLTGAGYAAADAQVETGKGVKQKFGPKVTAQWIWNDPMAAQTAKVGAIYLRKTVRLSSLPEEAAAMVYCDDSFELFANGHRAGSGADPAAPFVIDLKPWLKPGENVIAVRAVNASPGTAAPPSQNPAGLYVYARVRAAGDTQEKVMDFASDNSWVVTEKRTDGWEQPGFDAKDWTAAIALGPGDTAPWRIPGDTIARQFAARQLGGVRAAMVVADPLQVAMGRPNREQVVTTRASAATTLQALELTNGKTLAAVLQQGADNLLQQHAGARQLIRQLYQEGVGRNPTAAELKLAEGLLGQKPAREGLEDFLWAMVMQPEFQMIY